eukprot:TRINITY_DN6057_c0_g1_i1.p1 TRINITY_DN6057_c0_g1~~TRINITY_DN6057_c0_g1_i1.p1  ORF type:complete len:223 (+),score=36.02 TRINITY_DN6057_c0_g1_i1:143-811(+)
MLHTQMFIKHTRYPILSTFTASCFKLHSTTKPLLTNCHYQKVSFSSSSQPTTHRTDTNNNNNQQSSNNSNNKPKLPITSKAFWNHKKTWLTTSKNTLRCLAGCTLGDFSTMWYLQSFTQISTPLCMGLSMVAGISTSLLLETFFLRKLGFFNAFSTAMQMSFLSMLSMELTENLVDFYLTGGVVHLHSVSFWISAVVSALAGYLVPLPLNYWRLRRLGKCCH